MVPMVCWLRTKRHYWDKLGDRQLPIGKSSMNPQA
ncbi:hypothetical protein MCEMSE15_01777 [Fimbriimonadaceae bacterium]